MRTTAEYLKQYGVDPRAESLRLMELPMEAQNSVLKLNLKAYKNEVVEDKAVSIPYYYYFDHKGEAYTDPSLQPIFNLELQIDKRERQGLPMAGIYRALNLARENPHFLTALYSPEGPAAFDKDQNNPFSEINYTYGQLYLMYFDEVKVNALAIKIKDEGKKWLEELLTVKFRNGEKPDIEEIKTYIQTPVLLSTIEDFVNFKWRQNYLIYRSKKKNYYLDKVINTVKENFWGNNQTYSQNDETLYFDTLYDFNQLTEENIFRSYLSVIHRFLQENGEYGVALSGSCGGSMVTIDRVEMILGIKNSLNNNPFPQMFSGFSSVLRAFFKLDRDSWSEGNCLICGKKTMVGGCGWCKNCEHEAEKRSSKAKFN